MRNKLYNSLLALLEKIAKISVGRYKIEEKKI